MFEGEIMVFFFSLWTGALR